MKWNGQKCEAEQVGSICNAGSCCCRQLLAAGAGCSLLFADAASPAKVIQYLCFLVMKCIEFDNFEPCKGINSRACICM